MKKINYTAPQSNLYVFRVEGTILAGSEMGKLDKSGTDEQLTKRRDNTGSYNFNSPLWSNSKE